LNEAQIWRDGDVILPDLPKESGKFPERRPAAGQQIFYSILQDEGQNVLGTKSGRAGDNNRRSRRICKFCLQFLKLSYSSGIFTIPMYLPYST
jgi:hypothetical protein